MKKRMPFIITAGCVLAVGVVLVCRTAYRGLVARRGTAANVSELFEVYRSAGPARAGFYTNSLLQNMPFDRPISWLRVGHGSRAIITLTGHVNVVSFRRKMGVEPFQYLTTNNPPTFLKGKSGGTAVTSFTIHHRIVDWVVKTTGELDEADGSFFMYSWQFERETDDHQWHRLTNAALIEF